MLQHPYVLLSVATSLDGAIDDTSPNRLLLSNAADFDRVDQVRADSDAILIGAGTIRADNPRLIVYSEQRRADRVSQGRTEYPLKVTITESGNLDSDWNFWHYGGDKVVYSTDVGGKNARERLGNLADVVSLGSEISLSDMLDDLGKRGIRRLMVEGGSHIHTAFLSAGLVDEINLAIAPIVVGDADAPRFLLPARYPGGPTRRMRLVEAETIGDVVLLRYLPKEESGVRQPDGSAALGD